jgi:hypothetical protein
MDQQPNPSPYTVKQVHARRLNWAKRCVYAMKGLTEWLHQTRSIGYNTYSRLYLTLDAALDDIAAAEASLDIHPKVKR